MTSVDIFSGYVIDGTEYVTIRKDAFEELSARPAIDYLALAAEAEFQLQAIRLFLGSVERMKSYLVGGTDAVREPVEEASDG